MNVGIRTQIMLLVGLAACTGSGALAQQELPTVYPFELGYSLRGWTMDEGLKGPYVGAIVQGRDGSLHFSDSEGLIRYNGIELRDLAATGGDGVPHRNILAIHEGADGRLWTAGLGGQAVRERDGRWVSIGPDRGGFKGVGKFAEGPDGRLWCAVSASGVGLVVSVYEGGRFRPALREPVATGGYVQEVEFDSDGRLWLSVASQGAKPSVFCLEGDSLVPETDGRLRIATLFRKVGDERLWLVTPRGIWVRDRGEWREDLSFSSPLPEGSGFSACVVDADGNYWIGSRSVALWVCRPNGQLGRLISEEVKFSNFVRDVFTGRDGTIWFNGENGLLQLRRQAFTLWPQPQRHRHSAIRAMAEDGEGTLWFGGVGIYSLRRGECVRAHWENDNSVPDVYGMVGDRDGGAWFATGRGMLGKVDGSETKMVSGRPPNGGAVVDLAVHEGTVWLGATKSLSFLQDRVMVPSRPKDVEKDTFTCLAEGLAGELYVGFGAKGLFCHEDGEWSHTGLESWVSAISVAPDGSIWARGTSDVLYWSGHGEWLQIDSGDLGLPSGFHLVCSKEGSIWSQSLQGPVVRLDREAVESWMMGDRSAGLNRRTYGRAEGLVAERAPYGMRKRTLMEDRTGRVWVATVQGVCAWHPSHDVRLGAEEAGVVSMPVLVEQVFVDDEPVDPEDGRVTLTPDKNRIEIRYAGLDLASPESVSYRYRILGIDPEWIDVGNRHTAYLQRMPYGDYRFQVIAANRHGVWNEQGADLIITVLPHWWEHGLFKVGAPGIAIAILLGVVFLRIRSIRCRAAEEARLNEEFSRGLIEAQESERARIAGELHDDLGQDLLVMKSRIDLARRRSVSESEQEALQQMSGSAAEVLHKVRSLSHQLRPLHLDHLGLAASVRSLVKQVARAAKLDYEVEADDIGDELSPEAKVALYRVLQESLNNVIKHAGATSLRVELRRLGGVVSLVISDDGCGFDGAVDSRQDPVAGHGLRSMKERCALIGGSFDVLSTPGEGTLIRIEVRPRVEQRP